MALTTQGFSLSTMPRAPVIPGNVGAVDVREIYDGVRQGLAALENVRRAPAGMALADAEMKAKTLEAPIGTALAEEQLAQAPMKTAVLAFESSPEMLEAKRKATEARAVKPLTGTAYLLNRMDELRAALAAKPNDPALIAALADTQMALNKEIERAKITASAGTDRAKIIAQGGIDKATITAGGTPKEYAQEAATLEKYSKLASEAVDPDDKAMFSQRAELSRKRLDALNEQAGRANKIASDEAVAAADRASRETIAASQLAHKTAVANAKTDADKAKVGIKAKVALAVGEGRNAVFNRTVDRALDLLTGGKPDTPPEDVKLPGWNIAEASARVLAALFPGSAAKGLEGLIDTIKSEAGFNELTEMRKAAPGNTGASGLGQITEKELAFLQSRIANLKFSQSDRQLYDNIIEIRDIVNNAWKNARAGYEFDYGRYEKSLSGAAAPEAPSGQPAATTSEPPTVNSKEQYDALAPGANYRDAEGNVRVKGGRG